MKKKKLTILLLSSFLCILLIGATVFLIKAYAKIVVNQPDIVTLVNSNVTPTPTPTPDPMDPRNILIMGYAGGDHEGATLTDTLIVAHILPRQNKVTLISIPRDVFVPIRIEAEKTEKFKINHAFAIGLDDKKYPNKPSGYKGQAGAGKLTKDVIGLVTGLEINNFIAINFDGFTKIIDILGGVDVNIPYTFEDKYYPIKGREKDTCEKTEDDLGKLNATMSGQLLEKEFACRFETIKFEKGKVTLDSENALKFVRSRHSETNGNDFARSQRQQALIIAIKNKLLRISSIPKIIPIINSASKNMLTDIDIKTGIEILNERQSLKDVKVETISLNTNNVLSETLNSDHQYILIPKKGEGDWSEIHDYIKSQLNSP